MVMNVRLVCMGTNYKGMFALEKSGGEIIADLICFFWRNFTGLERLANLICDNIVLFVLAGVVLVLPFRKSKLRIYSSIIAGITRNQFAVIGFIGVYGVSGSICNALSDGFSFVNVHWNNASCCYSFSPPSM